MLWIGDLSDLYFLKFEFLVRFKNQIRVENQTLGFVKGSGLGLLVVVKDQGRGLGIIARIKIEIEISDKK